MLLWAGAAALAQADEPPTYAVLVQNGRITPATLEVPAGTRLRLAVRNAGTGPCEFENLALRVEKVLAPGAASTLVLHPLRAGSYRFVDEFHPDAAGLTLQAR
ncbi:cupredoxin domain-containing protein [Ideonella sp.]|uniref:cupredoxin domain-containing protein n=1 Tax=Ideonella sp. TaxID=1929293 RepID=UPI002B45E4F9|nr:cupredoxin domain-containing protein [Ideonella sp.]HJV67631.1 cupredoxin domain-containing protein [Ideonella sp.]